ncbi:MAG: outer membrane protein transport protein, partial [Pseudomonadota bacterium]|nr:outer membrane protein transport protein [Pseudomonadota bacterium]
WDITDKWTLSGTARWTRWKRFDTLNIHLDSNAPTPYNHITSTTKERWRNTGFYALGLDYKANDKWTIRGGVGYDMTVIRSAAHRTPRIPDGRRVLTSMGLSYTHKNMQFDAGYTRIFIYGGHAKGTDETNAQKGRPNIKYSSNANLLSIGFQYKF